MDPLTVARNIIGVATSLFGLLGKLRGARVERRVAMAGLFEKISDCLAAVSGEIRAGNVPHGRCGELITYAQELPAAIESEVGRPKADELGGTLHSAYNVEQLANDISRVSDKEPYLKEIEEAAGKFRALAHVVRAG